MPLAVDFQGGVTSAWSNVITFVPKLAAALLIILVGYLIAKVVASVLNKVLERVGFDRAVERGGLKQALARSKYDPSDIIAKLAFWLIFLVSLQIAFGVFGPNPISDLLQGLIAYLPNVLVAIVIIVVAAAIAKAVTDLLSNLLSSVSGGQVMAKGAGIAVLVFGAFAALDQLQIAPRIVTGLWYAILAIVVGSAVVAIGGGGIKTMQRYWERATTKAEERAPELTQQAQQSASTSAGDEGNGAAVYADPGPRSSRPSGPAGYGGTARPSRRRDASTGHRAEASRPPTNHPSTHHRKEVACHQASTPSRAGRAAPWSTRPATSSARSTPSTWTTRPASPSGPRSPAACSPPRPPSCPSPRPRPPVTASRCPTTSSRSPTPPAWRPTGACPRTRRPSCTATTAWTTASTAPTAACPPARPTTTPGRDTVGRDTSGPTTDDAMTRSEEELQVGTQTRERGPGPAAQVRDHRAAAVTVPVQREEVRVEREPITDANLDAATSGPAISEEEHEVTLREEEVVVEKRAVPKERVRLDTETVTEERQVSEEVRKEQIQVDDQDQLPRQDQR